MDRKAFLTFLRNTRKFDAAMGAALTQVGEYVLGQYHTHGNKTPHAELMLAVNGGIDTHGLFGTKGAEIKGLSKGVAALFTGLTRLGKRDENANVAALAAEATAKGVKTKAEASAEAKAKREKREAEKAAEEAKAPKAEPVAFALVGPNGVATKISGEEYNALLKTLRALRDQEPVNVNATVVDVQPAAAMMHLMVG